MNEILEKFIVDEGLHIYLQRNSTVWLARFKISGKWMSRTTKQRDKNKAITAAIKIKAGCEALTEAGHSIQTKAFRDVAKLAIERMDATPAGAKGQGSFKDYKLFLNRYHIPFFDRTHITNIDREKLIEFDRWREKESKRTPTQSTLKSHNAALQRVFDEAVIRKWMVPAQVPALSAASGSPGTRRDYFTPEEVTKITNSFDTWISESRTQASKDVRQLLFCYFQVAVYTGLRPGTEMDNLRWNDIQIKDESDLPHIVITVRKGKTTLHTGSRLVVAYAGIMDMILDMHARSHESNDEDFEVPDDYNPLVFRLPNGKTTEQLGRNFTLLLRRLKMENGPSGKRTLYSLRHTYITMKLLEGVPAAVIAKQCGTSTAMIELHYSHLTSLMYTKELVGNESGALTQLVRKYVDLM
ncbi:MAG TPA: tyrosine-type recombinase/integrase [Burkholderiaceae bacterium]|jgi:integrase